MLSATDSYRQALAQGLSRRRALLLLIERAAKSSAAPCPAAPATGGNDQYDLYRAALARGVSRKGALLQLIQGAASPPAFTGGDGEADALEHKSERTAPAGAIVAFKESVASVGLAAQQVRH